MSEEPLEDRICELVREAALELVNDELPHSLAVTLDEILYDTKKADRTRFGLGRTRFPEGDHYRQGRLDVENHRPEGKARNRKP